MPIKQALLTLLKQVRKGCLKNCTDRVSSTITESSLGDRVRQ